MSKTAVMAIFCVLVLSACGSNPTGTASDAVALAVLPVRDGPRTETTYSVPHVQLFAELVPEVDAKLRRLAYSLPGIENRESFTAIRGSRALWLGDEVDLARPDAVLRDREFGHFHIDGSLHTVLPLERALEATEAKWAELHPAVGSDDIWDGLVMLYTPLTLEELDITLQLIVDSYNFVTGSTIAVADLG